MVNVTSILARQRLESENKLKKEIVDRDIRSRIERYLDKSLIKVISGVRRSGKSMLALMVLKSHKFAYVNFDEEGLITTDLDTLLSGLKEVYGEFSFLLLDEIQNVKNWELWVNSLQRRGYNIILTGSNAKLLSKELATHLTGRYIEFENFTFSFREFLRWKRFNIEDIEYLKEKQGHIKNILREYMDKGGFPEYIVEELDADYIRTLFNSIIYADVVKRWDLRHPSKLEDLARYLLSIFGREYTSTKLKNLLGFKSPLTVQKYIKYLEEAYLMFSLERYSFKTKEFMKSPKKIYGIDSGLINAVSIRSTLDIGRHMENIVALELKRRGYRENKNFFYLIKDNKEIDFVIKEGINFSQLIQVTYASGRDEIENREIRNLITLSDITKCNNLVVITWDYENEEEIKGKKIRFIPLWKWLLSSPNTPQPPTHP